MKLRIIDIEKTKANHYAGLINRYEGYAFRNKQEEEDLLTDLKVLLNESDDEIGFENKIAIVWCLIATLKLKLWE